MSNEELIPVSWSCPWCRSPFEFSLKVGSLVQLAKREAACPVCDARIGLELQIVGDGAKLHVKRLSPGRAGRLEITQVDDQLAVSLVGRPLVTGDELALRRDGAWHDAIFAWDGSDEGRASVTVGGGTPIELDPAQEILRWPS